MPITFDTDAPYLPLNGHIVCFPAISQKSTTDDDPAFMKELYETLPATNYYTQHAAAASARGKPGCYNIHTIGGGESGVINMFIRLYAGNRVLSNDNLVLRVKYFKACTEQLVSCRSISKIHFFFPVKSPDDLKDYIQALEDFWSTYKLNNNVDLNIIVHHQEPSGRQPIVKQKNSSVDDDAAIKLLCADTQISEQSLFDVDFVRYVIKAATTEPEPLTTIMKYFPTGSQWNMLLNDTRLNQLAESISLDTVIGDTVYPPAEDMFNAFSYIRGGDPKVILLGQDPYHRKGQAHGLSFSVQRGIAIPPSLRNVYKALTNDVPGFVAPKHGNLTGWAEQGVLLLNSALTVSEGTPGSHLDIWEPFTNYLVSLISQKYKGLVFMLWGTKAKSKKALISTAGGHLILECQHPSPQIANNTFEKDCTHFSQANAWLQKHGKTEINWTL